MVNDKKIIKPSEGGLVEVYYRTNPHTIPTIGEIVFEMTEGKFRKGCFLSSTSAIYTRDGEDITLLLSVDDLDNPVFNNIWEANKQLETVDRYTIKKSESHRNPLGRYQVVDFSKLSEEANIESSLGFHYVIMKTEDFIGGHDAINDAYGHQLGLFANVLLGPLMFGDKGLGAILAREMKKEIKIFLPSADQIMEYLSDEDSAVVYPCMIDNFVNGLNVTTSKLYDFRNVTLIGVSENPWDRLKKEHYNVD